MPNNWFILNVVTGILIFLALVSFAQAFRESCPCQFIGECTFDEAGVPYKYYWCGGSCAAYSGWRVDMRCGANESAMRALWMR